MVNAGWLGNKSSSTFGAQENGMYGQSGVHVTDTKEFYSGQYESQYGTQQYGGTLLGSGAAFDSRYFAQDSNFLHNWQTNGCYLHQVMLFYS